ncbi:hypothetical protein [Lactiplantibacillus pentosus]|uniref:DUF2187 domain-containing protein n=1 Tax=Lactiplantibacillus pentosus TaxID=1589 RepID=A0AB37RCF7_LACPE|nr:hypothetical protein [Lactiplantibacillus pentosus]RMW41275.1 hypothetical protein D6U19_16805 [Lactiplantibacillus pentosus]RMW45105.1 hypothetical protein D6U20_09245 [Lactiplantibacillus pentosus]RMW51276.1 hypothetical protein D6U17_16510 [Lactiplantibacillus pentosus]RMW53722.1 hypothetical protein D6U21_11055 [Lactiplantibacillus pentosus]
MKVHVGDRVSYKAEYSCGQLMREAGVGKVVDIKQIPFTLRTKKDVAVVKENGQQFEIITNGIQVLK